MFLRLLSITKPRWRFIAFYVPVRFRQFSTSKLPPLQKTTPFIPTNPQLSSPYSQQIVEYSKVKQKLMNYPYSYLYDRLYHKKYIPDNKDFLYPHIIYDSIAYSALRQFNERLLKEYNEVLHYCMDEDGTHGNKLRESRTHNLHRQLRNQQSQFEQGEFNRNSPRRSVNNNRQLSGRQLFVKYFNKRLPDIKDKLQNSQNQQQIVYYLRTLYYLKINDTQFTTKLSSFKQIFANISKQGKLNTKVYLLALQSQMPQYHKFVDNFYKQFMESTDKKQNLKVALVILNMQSKNATLPRLMVERSLQIINEQIFTFSDWQLYALLSNIFEIGSPKVNAIIQKLTDHFFRNLNSQSMQTKSPLLLKILKIRHKKKMNNRIIEACIKENPKKFMGVFLKRKNNKQVLLDTVASKDVKRILPEEIRITFIQYIFATLKSIVQKEECDRQQIIEIVKMSLKFYHNFKQNDLVRLTQILKQNLIPMFQHQGSIGFYLIILLVRMDKDHLKQASILQAISQIQKVQQKEFEKHKQLYKKSQALEKINQINYHLMRSNNLTPDKYDSLFSHNYKYILTFQQIIYLCYTMSKLVPEDSTPAGREQLNTRRYLVLKQVKQRIEQSVQQNKFQSFSNIWTLLSFFQSCRCQNSREDKSMNYLYKAVEKGIMKLVEQERRSLETKNLLFIKRAFTSNRVNQNNSTYNIHLIRFLHDCISNPNNFSNFLQEYKSHQKTVPK